LHSQHVSAQSGRGDEHENHSGPDKQQIDPHGKTVAHRQRRFRADDELGNISAPRACESGVALRLPPQSKMTVQADDAWFTAS
jgi:hypothetical protein